MNYYQEITLLPEAEVSLGFIWQNIFQQVHFALVENKTEINHSNIAVGFPQYRKSKFPLGNKLRLFAENESQLEQLDIHGWLKRLADYVHIKSIQLVPDTTSYVSFSRKQVKSAARIDKDMQEKAEIWAKQSDKSISECIAELEKTKPQAHCDLPYIYLFSQETKKHSPDKNNKFPLFIKMEMADKVQNGKFDCYGLSAKSNMENSRGVVPWF